jgi:AraC-like DNA-binding protein
MPATILLVGSDESLWKRLEEIKAVDPAVNGGIHRATLGHRALTPEDPVSALFTEGHEEIHSLERGFSTLISDVFIRQDWQLTTSSLDRTLRLRILFAGDTDYVAQDLKLTDESSRCAFIVRPPGETLTANFRGGLGYRLCALSLTQDYLKNTLQLTDDALPPRLLDYWDRHETVMGHFAVSKTTLAQANRLFNPRSSAAWRDLEVHATSLELLRMLLEDWSSSQPRSKNAVRITADERTRLLRVRDLIEKDPTVCITIPQLCRISRMNRNKLHSSFKQLFGASMHDFQNERRMQIALKLLESTRLPIGEVASRTGYSEPTNFTAAFKRHFAVLPRQVRGSQAAD